MDKILYTTPKEQIEKLKSQNLIIDDDDFAESALHIYGYSNLIKSYRQPYLVPSTTGTVYRSGVTFEQILSLYLLDKNLRNAVMAAMLDLEEHLRETAADVIACAFGTHHNEYLQYRNYSNKKKRHYRFTLTGILETLNKTLNTEKNPICHYKKVHGVVPPWILFTSVYFGTLINFIDQFKQPEKNGLVDRLYNLDELDLTLDKARMLMSDTLSICLEYRNIAAHGGRIYNYEANSKLRVDHIFTSTAAGEAAGFNQLLFSLSYMDYNGPFTHLKDTLDREVNRHCSQFPQDVEYLEGILNIGITRSETVYVSPRSKKYHLNPFCSGLNTAIPMELNEAKELGFVACKRCMQQ